MTDNGSTNINIKSKSQNPFVGIRPLTSSEKHLFFGRDKHVKQVLEKLFTHHFVVISGASGIGKSSLVNCGVIPQLLEHGKWKDIHSEITDNPLENLHNDILNLCNKDQSGNPEDLNNLRNPELVKCLKQDYSNSKTNYLFFVDQFEQLILKHGKRNQNEYEKTIKRYISVLTDLIKQKDVPVYIIMTMRSDYIGELSNFTDFAELINSSNYLLPQMSDDDMFEAIKGPLEYAGAQWDPKLPDRIINDLGGKQDKLPLMQHVLLRTYNSWKESTPSGSPIGIANYEEVGTAAGALEKHAEEAYDELDRKNKEVCARIFKSITEKTADNRYINHPTRISELAQIAQADEYLIIRIVNIFNRKNRSFLVPPEDTLLTEESYISLSHEALIRNWNRLKDWVEEEAESIMMYKKLADSAFEFQLGKTDLWTPPELDKAIEWREKNSPNVTWARRYNPAFERTMVFLNLSENEFHQANEDRERAQKLKKRLSRIIGAAAGVALIIVLFLTLFPGSPEEDNSVPDPLTGNQSNDQVLDQVRESENQPTYKAAEGFEDPEEAGMMDYPSGSQGQSLADNYSTTEDNNEQDISGNPDPAISERFTEISRPRQSESDENTFDRGSFSERQAVQAERQPVQTRTGSVDERQREVQASTQSGRTANTPAQVERENSRSEPELTETRQRINRQREESARREVSPVKEEPKAVTKPTASREQAEAEKEKSSSLNATEMANVAGSMAQRSIQTEGDQDLKALLAYQSYLFNKEYNNNNFRLPVYEALYRSMQAQLGNSFAAYEGHSNAVRSVDFIPNSSVFYSTGSDGTVLRWNLANENKKFTRILSGRGVLEKVRVTNNGRWLLIAENRKGVLVLNLASSGSSPDLVRGEDLNIRSIAVAPDNNTFYTAGTQNHIAKCNITARSSEIIIQTDSRINSLALSPDGKTLAAGTRNGKIITWSTSGNYPSKVISSDAGNTVQSVSFSPDGRYLACGTQGGRILLFRTGNFEKIRELSGHSARVTEISFSPGGDFLASAAYDGKVLLYDMSNLSASPVVFDDNGGFVFGVSFSGKGDHLVSGSAQPNHLVVRPVSQSALANRICFLVSRNMSESEWNNFVGSSIPYRKTCPDK